MTDSQKELIREVYERDEGRCQDCGQRGIDVHHIIHRRHLGAWSAQNMITLCRECHRRADSKESKKRHLTHLRDKYGYQYSKRRWLSALEELA